MNLISKLLPVLSRVISPNWTVYKDVQYGPGNEEVLDMYLLNKGVRPAIIFIHGGGWMGGDKAAYEGRARKYALAGFHVFAINYRLAKQGVHSSQWNAQLQDVQLAVRWLRANAAQYRVDPNKIAVGGDSAGAHLSLFLGALDRIVPAVDGDRHTMYTDQSPKACAVLDMFGPTDLTTPKMQETVMTTPLFDGKTYAEAPSLYAAASPIFYINNTMSPTFIVHGTSDIVVPYSQSTALAQKLTSLGVYHKFLTFNGGHEMDKVSTWTQFMLELKGLWFMVDVVKG